MSMEQIAALAEGMKSDTIENYVIAGLDSSLLNNGKVRLFECSRNHQDSITPHSHRFDFCCLVLRGSVVNRVWRQCVPVDGDFFEETEIVYSGAVGYHEKNALGRDHYTFTDKKYGAGEVYSMSAAEIHSISFSRGAKVLFFEGPPKSDKSVIIEPVVNGALIQTYENRDYMFLKADD